MDGDQSASIPADRYHKADPRPRWTNGRPYRKLQPEEIRLLAVSPVTTDLDLPLKCTLETYALSTAPTFAALSYTWGSPLRNIEELRKQAARSTSQVHCNGKEAHIGQNLYDFLLHHAYEQTAGRYLWIDALSINQDDVEERSEQVTLMGAIYQKANEVLVWLGPEDHLTESAISLLQRVVILDEADRSALHPADASTHHSDPLLNLRNWRALTLFFQREWFRRTCTLISEGTRTLGQNTPARLAAAKKTWKSGHDSKFLYALIRARPSESEDLRDKVYSQLGLGDADIFPDYKASVGDVYTVAARYILEHSESLFLLTCVEGEEFQKVPGLPSWVPDWSVSKTISLRVTGYPDYHAALQIPKRQTIFTDEAGKHVLSIEATKLDDIVDICESKGPLHNNLHTSCLWDMIAKLDPMYAAAPEEPQSQYPASCETFGPSFKEWVLWRYVSASDEPTTFPHASSDNKFVPTRLEIEDARQKSRSDATYVADLKRRGSRYDLIYSHAMLLRPFCTKNGYFGIGTLCLRKGDSLWIAPGCPVPLILRLIEGSERYRLVGGSYVHGFMNGEILKRPGLEFSMVNLE
ncbi:hypothetical protein EK21DRAFT_51879 [Setomelanomma holmii]|uniref:Heterokaryon incompatibility domain-containing protein n=1 Tax=Setomelanomma holmii TaxID=210430 RepID=A0A9P4LVF0_9PLEO|nr:hypothetical protein EK21DRAFT_51879 [Setomelanomma holmii]